MSRPIGSKNKTTVMKENGNVKPVKKVISTNNLKEHIKEVNKKKGRPVMPKHVLRLTDWLYIQADSHCWTIKEVVTATKPNGEKYPDKAILFYHTLEDAIKGAVRYSIRVPMEFEDLIKKLDSIYSLIDARIPADIKVRDLFEDVIVKEEEDEE